MNLYELSAEYMDLAVRMGDVDKDEIPKVLEELNAIDDSFNNKAVNVVKMIKSYEADAAAVKEEKKRLNDRQQTLENKAKRLKEYLYDNMKLLNKNRINSELFNISIRKNPPKLVVSSDQFIPEQYWIPQPSKLDKQALLSDLKANVLEVDGVEVEQNESVSIR